MDKLKQWLTNSLEIHKSGKELSKKTGINDKTLSRWKNGKIPMQWALLVQLARGAGISLDELLLDIPKKENINHLTSVSSRVLSLLQNRLSRYDLDSLSNEDINRLLEMVDILVGILTSLDEKTKVSICNNLDSFKELVWLKTTFVINKSQTNQETDRASPSKPEKPKNTNLGGNRAK